MFVGLDERGVGSALGGPAYGSRGWHFPLARQFAVALALTALGLALLSLRWQPWLFATLLVVAGIAIAPALIIQSMLVTKTTHGLSTPPRRLPGRRAHYSREWESGWLQAA